MLVPLTWVILGMWRISNGQCWWTSVWGSWCKVKQAWIIVCLCKMKPCNSCVTKLILHIFSDSEVMQVERKWHILLTIFFLLITSGQCMDSKEVKQKERRTLLDLILQVIRDSQQRDRPVSRRCSSGLFTSARDMKFSSREKPFYVPRLDNSRLIGKLIRFIFRSWWWKHNPHFTVGDSCHWSGLCCTSHIGALFSLAEWNMGFIWEMGEKKVRFSCSWIGFWQEWTQKTGCSSHVFSCFS